MGEGKEMKRKEKNGGKQQQKIDENFSYSINNYKLQLHFIIYLCGTNVCLQLTAVLMLRQLVSFEIM